MGLRIIEIEIRVSETQYLISSYNLFARLRKLTHIFTCCSWKISEESINFNCLNISSNLHNGVGEEIKSESDVLVPAMMDINREICCVQFLDYVGQLQREGIGNFDNGASGYGHCICVLLDFVHGRLRYIPYLLLDLQYPFVSWDVFEFE